MILVDAFYVHKWFDDVPHTYTYIGYPQGYSSPDKARVVSFLIASTTMH